MTMNDPLANAMSQILNAEKNAKSEATLRPSSKLLKRVLEIMKEEGYLGEYTEIEDGKGNQLKINLLGKINKCGVIKPRFALTLAEFEKFEKRFLPAQGFGILIISTSQGVITLDEAKKRKIGGKLLAYAY
jgi:small subunit ribosomal protein S8